MDSKVMIGIGVAIAAAAGVGIYLYTKKSSDPNAAGQMTPSNVKPAVQGAGNAYAPPTGGGGKSTGDKIQRDIADVAKADAECSKLYPDKASIGYLSCMALKGASTLG